MPVTVAAEKTTADSNFDKVSNFVLVDQLTPAEIVNSLPGTPEQAQSVTECGVCHSMSRILKSTHDAEEFKQVILRMRNHTPRQMTHIPKAFLFICRWETTDEALANFLATINLSTKSEWDYQFKPNPRPKGDSEKVIITEYDLPRRDGEPHDAMMDSDGMIWYADFVAPIIGRLNPQTGEFKEWPLPEIKPGFPQGSLGVALDPKGNPWIGRAFQGGVATMDKKTEKITSYRIPKEFDNEYVRNTFIAVGKDGTVCFDDPSIETFLLRSGDRKSERVSRLSRAGSSTSARATASAPTAKRIPTSCTASPWIQKATATGVTRPIATSERIDTKTGKTRTLSNPYANVFPPPPRNGR